MRIEISTIKNNPFQSRTEILQPELNLLVHSIKSSGWWNTPLRVRKNGSGYELVWGHRRLAALKQLGRETVEVEVVPLTDLQMAEESLTENCQRENLTDVDKADSIARWLDMLLKERFRNREAKAIEYIGKQLGYRPSSVEELLNVAKLSRETKDLLRTARTGWGVVNAANRLGGEKFVSHIARSGLGIKEVERMRLAIAELPVQQRRPIVERVIREKITSGEVVKELVRREAARLKPRSSSKPEIGLFLKQWSGDFEGLADRIQVVVKFKKEVRENYPAEVALFRTSWEKLVKSVTELMGK